MCLWVRPDPTPFVSEPKSVPWTRKYPLLAAPPGVWVARCVSGKWAVQVLRMLSQSEISYVHIHSRVASVWGTSDIWGAQLRGLGSLGGRGDRGGGVGIFGIHYVA